MSRTARLICWNRVLTDRRSFRPAARILIVCQVPLLVELNAAGNVPHSVVMSSSLIRFAFSANALPAHMLSHIEVHLFETCRRVST